ncbi:MAG: DUF6941 family protein [Gemmatimonas sp.]|uniref:DUF6941 family protein n=1 Tax=Gemmatimonas sp. TaxID=1962908 RepID=UPI00391F07DE
MHVSFALFSDAANISQEGKLNILGIFDAVHVGQFPALHPRTTFVLRLQATAVDVGHHTMVLRWVNPRGLDLWTSEAQLEVGPPPPGTTELDMPIIVQLDLPLDMLGDYHMRVAIGQRDAADLVLHVRGGAPPVVPAGPGQMVS